MFASFSASGVYSAEARMRAAPDPYGGCDRPPAPGAKRWLDSTDKDEPVNWSYEPLSKEECKSLTVGDIVRLRFVFAIPGEDRGWWNKIYVQIVDIAYYTKGNKQNVPRTFTGVVLDTYFPPAIEGGYVKEGEVVQFQRKNVIEIPGWKATDKEVRESAIKAGRKPPVELKQPPRVVYDQFK